MTLQERIDELSAATDGAQEDTSFKRTQDPLFPEITHVRVMYKKRYEREIEFSQILILVENIDTPEEVAYYVKDRTPAPVIHASITPEVPNATPEEIKENLDTIFPDTKFWDIQIQTGAEAGTVAGMFYSPDLNEAEWKTYRVTKDEKGVFAAYLVKR